MGDIGSGAGTAYPTALDTQSTPEVNWPSVSATEVDAEWANDVVDSILAIQAELGATDSQNFVRSDGGDTINISGASVKGLIIKAAVSQTANLQEWQDSSGTVLSAVDKNGTLQLVNGEIKYTADNTRLYVANDGGATITIQDANNTTRDARLRLLTGGGSWDIKTLSNNLVLTHGTGALVTLGRDTFALKAESADDVPLLIAKGQAGQTANLQEWQDSSGTPLLQVTKEGAVVYVPMSSAPAHSDGLVAYDDGTDWGGSGEGLYVSVNAAWAKLH